jgi:hypothetical protein
VTKEIRQADFLTEAEKEKLFGWGDDIFGADDLKLSWRRPQILCDHPSTIDDRH